MNSFVWLLLANRSSRTLSETLRVTSFRCQILLSVYENPLWAFQRNEHLNREAPGVMQFSRSGSASRRVKAPCRRRAFRFHYLSRCLKLSILSFIPWLFIYAAINNGNPGSTNRRQRRTYFWIVPTAAERDEPVDGGFNDDRRRRLIAESSRED